MSLAYRIMCLVTGCLAAGALAAQTRFEPDPHSFSRPDEVVVTHIDLDLRVDFSTERLSGSATLHIQNHTGTTRLILDTRALDIQGITLDSSPQPAVFSLGTAVAGFGRPLVITIESTTQSVTIMYATTDSSDALLWLNPEQTSGRQKPFLFTQSEAILARTWIPCQDSPGIRATYTARITCPSDVMAVMSARNDTARSKDGVYYFVMDRPIPSYLFALAVGDIGFRSLGGRCGVYAERPVIDKAAWEFADVGRMLTAAERLLGPYRWERYDIIVLPPSFPFGGMENPRLTFATPTIMAGDRSLVSLIAHELAHSWSGNLVTNAVWNDAWLNEGLTTYFERRIVEEVYGKDYAEMEAIIGRASWNELLSDLGPDSADSRLYLHLEHRQPDDASEIIYEKGCYFFRMLEAHFGRDKLDHFIRAYLDAHAFQSITTETFLRYLRTHLLNNDQSLEKELRIAQWVYGTGIPANCPVAHSDGFVRVDEAVTRWRQGVPASQLTTAGWVSQQWIHFVGSLPAAMTPSQMAELDGQFHFSESGNSEVLYAWLVHVIENKFSPDYPALRKFLTHVGRRKFVRPLYLKLAETEDGKELALSIYKTARPGYHALTSSAVDAILGYQTQ